MPTYVAYLRQQFLAREGYPTIEITDFFIKGFSEGIQIKGSNGIILNIRKENFTDFDWTKIRSELKKYSMSNKTDDDWTGFKYM